MKTSTKHCPHCGSTALVLYSSTNEKQCSDCHLIFEWTLDEGQPPLVGPARNVQGSKA
ncbi:MULTISPECIES: hypothetical protein [Cobetia]|uniref:hypothetical protein n=1 Tax=Cobetia TaxID=204286 RepID=UPI001581A26C|nr:MULTISPECIES: hypothetical protein [Cobetia]MDI4659525.1 hypothetical protein [Cobetia sp. BMC6]NUJ56073.1 hypothetical protein [Cobetia marina]